MTFPFNARALLESNRPNDELGPFDGKTAAVIDNWIITTPNQDVIWRPPWEKRRVRLRSDVRYGVDDPTLWPQAYVIEYPHLGAIPRKPHDDGDPLAIMWRNPTESDFIRSPNALVDGLGQLSKSQYQKLDILKKQLLERVDQYKKTTSSPDTFLLCLSKAMHHSCIRLGFLSTTFLEMTFGVTEFQRYYLETLGLLDYLMVYKPRMDGVASRPSTADNRIGVFTGSPRVVQEFYDAGLPVWFIRETKIIAASPNNAPNVLKLVEPRDSSPYLALADCVPSFPVVYEGYTNSPQKYAAIHSYSRTWMVYRDAFSQEGKPNVKEPIDPFKLSRGPAQCSDTIPMSELLAERLPRSVPSHVNVPQARRIHAKAHDSTGRDKFTDPDSPFLPPKMPVWANALRSVDRSPDRVRQDAKRTYALPEPAIFVTPANEKKRISFLLTWLKCRVAWLWRLELESQVALTSQMWRDLLGMNYNQTAREETSAGKRREQISKIMGNAIGKPGVSFSSLHGNEPAIWREEKLADDAMPPTNVVQEILWELYELSFRFEFLALDSHLSNPSNRADIADCFAWSEGNVTCVKFSNSNYGLVADDWHIRLPYVMALVNCMQCWNVAQAPSAFEIVDRGRSTITEAEALELEEAAASFYTQQFFDYFGRAAIIPHRIIP